MTQQTEAQTNRTAHIVEHFKHVDIPADLDSGGGCPEPMCPQCGAPCNHTPQEMQGFAVDAAADASEFLSRESEACRLANEADTAAKDAVHASSTPDVTAEASTIAVLTRQVNELRSAPPVSFVELENDSAFREWMRMLTDGATSSKMRREAARSIREVVKACADAQRSASVTALYQAAANGSYLRVEDGLPAPYEEVRILFDGQARIARLAHDKRYFQLASFLSSTKHQYVVALDRVQGWQPLMAAPLRAPLSPE